MLCGSDQEFAGKLRLKYLYIKEAKEAFWTHHLHCDCGLHFVNVCPFPFNLDIDHLEKEKGDKGKFVFPSF